MESSEIVSPKASNEKTIKISSGNFRDRFCDITGIDKIGLENIYSEMFNGAPIQEVIWEKAKKYFKDKLAFNLNIPTKTKGPGRYVRYPKSQIVLNKEDLKEVGEKTLTHLFIEEAISEEHFYKLFLNEFTFQTFNRNNNKTNYEGTTRDIFLKQVFNYYNSGEWETLAHKNVDVRTQKKTKYFIEFGLSNMLHFYIHTNEIENPYELFKGSEIFIFEKVYGTEEYEQSSIFSLNTELILASRYPLKIGSIVNHQHTKLHIVSCTFKNENDIPIILKDRLRKMRDEIPVHLKGIRLGHKWHYIQNFGPEIIGEEYSIINELR